jgi:hypothetical protein
LDVCGGTCDFLGGVYFDCCGLDILFRLELFQDLRRRIRPGLFPIFPYGLGLYRSEHGAGEVQGTELPNQMRKEEKVKGCCQAVETGQD